MSASPSSPVPAAPDSTGPTADRDDILRWSWWKWALLIFGLATLFGLVQVTQASVRSLSAGKSVDLVYLAKGWMPDYYLWAALTPLIVWLGVRFPLDEPPWLPRLGVHVAAASALVPLELLASSLVVSWLLPEMPGERFGYAFWPWYRYLLSVFFMWGFFIYWVILAASYAFRWYRRSREQELHAAELEGRLARAQLRALKMQLHPHFLFNTLHSIGVLVRKNERSAALEMLSGLGDLLRYSLENADRQEVPLREELEFLERYLEIEEIRFRDRLRVEFDVDPRVFDVAVPNLLLQPLVENAIRHGVAPSAEPRTVRISARGEDDRVVLSVRDDGPGFRTARLGREAEGVGLRNVRERLAKLYGDDAALAVESASDGGVVATVTLPGRPLAAPSEAGAPERSTVLTAGGTG